MIAEARSSGQITHEDTMRLLRLTHHCFLLQMLIQINFGLKSERVTASLKAIAVFATQLPQ